MARISTVLCDLLGIKHPIIQGGMGPCNTARLAAAVSVLQGQALIEVSD